VNPLNRRTENLKITKIIDLSMPLEKGMRTFPGIPEPILAKVRTHNADGLQVSKLETVVHTGTHVDAPRHVKRTGNTTSNIHLDSLIGDGVVLNLKYKSPGSVITEDDLSKFDSEIRENDIVVLNTGYEKYPDPEKYCTIKPGAAHWLVKWGIKCLAVDMPSLDPLKRTSGKASEETHPSHHIILSAGIPIVEFMVNLDALQGRIFFVCLPIKISECDAAPARVIALKFSEP
jgi:kynurenine formamidase